MTSVGLQTGLAFSSSPGSSKMSLLTADQAPKNRVLGSEVLRAWKEGKQGVLWCYGIREWEQQLCDLLSHSADGTSGESLLIRSSSTEVLLL